MSKYRKKPVVIEAEQYKPGMEDGFEKVHHKDCFCCQDSCKGCIHYKPYINTLEGRMYISENDFIITGIKGERYPCKPDIFHATYDLVEE